MAHLRNMIGTKEEQQEIQVYLECFLENSFLQVNLPPSYNIRKYCSGQENEWTRIQNLVFGPEKNRKFEKTFITETDKEGVFFAYCNKQVVGIAAARVKTTSKGNKYGILDWVGVQKAYQGKRLGSALSVAALNYLKELRVCSYVSVRTPQHRRPAISLYQKLGFVVKYIGEKKSAVKRQEKRADVIPAIK